MVYLALDGGKPIGKSDSLHAALLYQRMHPHVSIGAVPTPEDLLEYEREKRQQCGNGS